MKLAIIGGGIGGLTLAIGLRQNGYDVTVYEQAPELGEVGAGLGLMGNATRALEQIGIPSSTWQAFGYRVERAELAEPSGRVLSSYSFPPSLGDSYVLHRADLYRVLQDHVEAGSIHTGSQLLNLEEKNGTVELSFSGDRIEKADLVFGADGLFSRTRELLSGLQKPSYSGETCYRGIARLNSHEKGILREVQGRGKRCSVIPLDSERIYWWATIVCPEGEEDDPGLRQQTLLAEFQDWSFGIGEAIAATPSETILRNDLYDRPPIPHWTRGRVALLGDAAHPTTPNLGQGACMAIEDAVYLARKFEGLGLSNHGDVFAAYEKDRMPRCYRIVSQSRRFGWLAANRNPLVIWIRETGFRMTPGFVLEGALKPLLGYEIS